MNGSKILMGIILIGMTVAGYCGSTCSVSSAQCSEPNGCTLGHCFARTPVPQPIETMFASPIDPACAGFPELFQYSTMGLPSFSFTEITIESDGTIRKRSYPYRSSTRKDDKGGKLTVAQWQSFLRKIDSLYWWGWNGYYDNPDVFDGDAWTFRVKTGSLNLHVGGRSAGPSVNLLQKSPTTRSGVTESTGNQVLLKALLELWEAAEPNEQLNSFRLFKRICGLPLNTTMLQFGDIVRW